jgi:hypothetical protein
LRVKDQVKAEIMFHEIMFPALHHSSGVKSGFCGGHGFALLTYPDTAPQVLAIAMLLLPGFCCPDRLGTPSDLRGKAFELFGKLNKLNRNNQMRPDYEGLGRLGYICRPFFC